MMATSIGELWHDTTARVGDRSSARWLCEVATGLDADELRAALAEPVTDRMIAHLDHMLGRLDAGEPLQYVLGRWAFRRVDLAIDRRVLIPRPETELVAEVAIELARDRLTEAGEVTIVDLGTGSGAIGLAMADELPLDGVSVWLTDASPDALDVARANLAGLGRRAANVRIAEGSWLDALPDGVVVDVIVSNPPYIADGSPDIEAEVARWEPAGALYAGHDGLDAVRTIVAGARSRVAGVAGAHGGGVGWRPGGWMVLEIGHDQGDAVAALLRDAGYRDIEIVPDLAGHDRIARARAPQ